MTILARVVPSPNGDYAAVFTAWHPAIVAQFKAMPGIVWHSGTKAWTGPREAILEVVKTLTRANIIVADESHVVSEPRVPDELVEGLYDYQADGVRFLIDSLRLRHGALLADDMGLGKSAQTARAIATLGPASTLILCPAVVVKHWLAEWYKWTGELADELGRKLTRDEGGGRLIHFGPGTPWKVIVGSYDTFRALRHKTGLSLADAVVLDELHYLASPKAQRSRAVREYITACRTHRFPTYVVGLTGTPMTARPRDLWHPLDIIYPGRFGARFNFERRYCDGRWEEIKGLEKPVWSADGQSNLDELGRRLQGGGIMLRRVKSEVLELPDRQRILLPVELPPAARKAAAKATASFGADRDVGKLLSIVEEYKLAAAAELAADLMAQGRTPLLLTLRRETANKLAEKLGAPAVTGAIAPGKRAATLAGAPCGIATVYSVTTGINLTEYDTVIFVGLDWVPSTLLQAEARIHRIGQDKSVLFYYLIGLGTVDEVVQAKVLERLDAFATVVGNAADEEKLAATLRGNKSEQELLDDIVKAVMGL